LGNASLLVHNGSVYLRPDPKSRVEALSIVDGRVSKVGSAREILRLKSASTQTLDLEGRAAFPGLADSHIHLLGTGMLMRTLDLSKARSILEIQNMLAKASSGRSREEWIIGRGWDQEKLQDHRYPDRSDADVVPNPVFLRRVCGHVALANSVALATVQIDEKTPDPFGGEIERDSTGRLSGLLKERALGLVAESIPRDETESREALIVAARKLLSQGVTSLHCIIEDSLEFKVLRDLKKNGKIEQSIYAILPVSMLDQAGSLVDKSGESVEGFKVGGLKIFLDGSLGARTAALERAYNDEPGTSGMLTTSREQLVALTKKAREMGLQLCIHAIGDKAVELAVETLKREEGAEECKKGRHRIEHASLLSSDLIKEMSRLGLVASVQPRFIYSDSWAEKRLGTDRVRYLYPFESMIQAGIRVAAGSDSPSDDPSVAEGLWSAVFRPGLLPNERLTAGEALSCYTVGGAYASFLENDEGTLVVGKWGNMVVFDRDPLECAPEDLWRLKVVQTVVHGRVFTWD
jgi:predicted amidohydrolase YtcJ